VVGRCVGCKLLKHVLTTELNKGEIVGILRRAKGLMDGGSKRPLDLAGKVGVLLFDQPSTRTVASFYRAMKYLNMKALNLPLGSTSVEKGETLEATLQTLDELEYDVAVVRAVDNISTVGLNSLHVVNAGGMGYHPTQALADALTINARYNSLEEVTVNFRGDVQRSRVAQSTRALLEMFGVTTIENGPLDAAPVAYQIRQQNDQGRIMSDSDYKVAYGITDALVLQTPGLKAVMHAGPVIEGIDIDRKTLGSNLSLVKMQVRAGLFVRIALLEYLLMGEV
jgi:aspartate carbamoyltransferase catalytic subunit